MPLSRNDSSITSVVRALCAEHARAGGTSTVVTSHNRETVVPHANLVPVDYMTRCPRGWFTRGEVAVDHLLGAVGGRRPHVGGIFLPAIEALRSVDPEVVLLHEGHYATSSLPYWRDRYPGACVVLYVHTPLSRAYTRRELHRLLSLADGGIFVSQHVADRVAARVAKMPWAPQIIHNGIDRGIFNPDGRMPRAPGGPLRVTYAGQIAEHKGVHHLISAVERVPGATLAVIGRNHHGATGGLDNYELELRRKAVILSRKVDFMTFLPQADLAEQLRRSDVVVVPSKWEEPFGMVALEAMACGAAVVASRVGGLPEACGTGAILTEPDSVEGLVQALSSLRDDGALIRAQAAATQRARQVPWSAVYGRLSQYLSDFSPGPQPRF